MKQQIEFKKAERQQRKFKGALIGVSGSGKTWTALELATGLANGGRVCLLDTENSSASLYADDFDFDTFNLSDYSVESYVAAMQAAAAAGASVLVIDSLSHSWNWILDEADNIAQRSNSKNSFAAWKQATPIYEALVAAIVSAPIHVIATMRAKSDYVMDEVERNGKTYTVPRKVGLAPIFRAGGEYEFDFIGTMDLEHRLVAEKSRINFLADMVALKPDHKLGSKIREWIESGAPAPVALADPSAHVLECKESKEHGRTLGDIVAANPNWLAIALDPKRRTRFTGADIVNMEALLLRNEKNEQ